MSARTVGQALAADMRGLIPGFDDPAAAERWTAGRAMDVVVLACVMDLDLATREAFLAAFEQPWEALIVADVRHPQLAQLATWVADYPGDVLLLASPSGPTPPAVVLLEPLAPKDS